MKTEQRVVATISAMLRDAGYAYIEREARIGKSSRLRADLVAWGRQADGQFGPVVCVEVRRNDTPLELQTGMATLSAMASILGTSLNLLVLDERILLADSDFEAGSEINEIPPAAQGVADVTDVAVLETLIARRAWQLADDFRDRSQDAPMRGALEVLSAAAAQSGSKIEGPVVGTRVERSLFATAWMRTAARSSRWASEGFTPESVCQAMTRLALPLSGGELVLDPFAGHAGNLIFAHQASAAGASIQVQGVERNVEVCERANKLLQLAGAVGKVQLGDSLRDALPQADTVITAPPLGLRLSDPVASVVGPTRDGDVAALSVIANSLKPGGRAVILTSRSWTFKTGACARMRAWLAENRHVVALIGLPPVLDGVGIAPLLVVIDHQRPAETLVADLGADWQEHLAEGSILISQLPSRAIVR